LTEMSGSTSPANSSCELRSSQWRHFNMCSEICCGWISVRAFRFHLYCVKSLLENHCIPNHRNSAKLGKILLYTL
jgi:hypothetical protein